MFLSNRGKSGLTQLFQLNLPSNISATSGFIEPIQITDLPMSINDLLVDRQATHLAFSCQVYPNLSIEETASRQADENANHGSVYKFDKLFIRQSNGFIHGLRLHPFVAEIRKNSNGIYNFVNKPRDLLFNIDSDSSITTFSNGQRQWSFSASGKKFAFVRRNDQTSEVAWTTNYNIFMIDLTNPHSQPICITENNLAVDAHPRYSPIDEDVLLYLAQSVPGYTPDQYKIKLYNGECYSSCIQFTLICFLCLGSTTITLLDNWDRNIGAVTWSPDGQSIFLELAEQAHNVIYKITGIFSPLPFLDRLISVGSSYDVNIHPTNDEMFLFMHSSITEPPNIYLFSSARQMKPMTNHNTNWMNKVRISKAVEKFHFIGALNETVWGWHVAPVNDTDQKAPLAFLIHGGPYSAECDEWSYGWSYQLFASQGYAVIAINFHGSTSYGQKFTDSVTGQFGSLPFEDLKLGLTAALTRYPYIDENRAVAIGGSYGGYMVNWIAGHPEMSQRFKALISDAGIFNLKELAYSVDELSFTEASVGGFTPYENPDAFERFNPANHVANWTQPMLIIHGRDDYRVPDTQGISAFTALQRRGIPSRLVYFPKEGHSIGNRFNSIVKCQEILDWMNRWTA